MTSSKTPPETTIIVLGPLASKKSDLIIRRQVVGTASVARFPALELERERLDQLRQIFLQRLFLVDRQLELSRRISIRQLVTILVDEIGARGISPLL